MDLNFNDNLEKTRIFILDIAREVSGQDRNCCLQEDLRCYWEDSAYRWREGEEGKGMQCTNYDNGRVQR